MGELVGDEIVEQIIDDGIDEFCFGYFSDGICYEIGGDVGVVCQVEVDIFSEGRQ